MPRVKASARVNLKDWQPLQNTAPGVDKKDNPPAAKDPNIRRPFMHASMPLMASTNDALSQFYSPQNIPQQRILPAKKGGVSQ